MLVEKILVANRGEIACRVIRTVKKMGFTAVAVFSEADRDALFVQKADESILIGGSEPAQSYLNIENIIEAAKHIQADAIHPGYGFLSENSLFAKRCHEEQLIFIGPTPEAIELMGSKSKSKAAMLKNQVPCIPGYQGENQTDDALIQEAQKIGFPIMVKAAAGGGGRGMRKVINPDDLKAALHSARSEAQTAFGHPELILERAINNGRHIEIQVLADTFGHCIHLGERDCSLQRRHQKIIEEAPSPIDRARLRQAMGEAAVTAAQSCNYVGAGTVEFLVDDSLNFYFLEMNTRIQVEHPVTELVTDIDIVEQQIRVALGEPLQYQQKNVKLTGHAIEARLYAEDPSQNYLPQTGRITVWHGPNEEGLRCDTGIQKGSQVSSHYDPMLAKIIGYGENRAQALRRLARGLRHTVICGVKTNRDFLIQLLDADYVREGQFDTSTLQSQTILEDLFDTSHNHEAIMTAHIVALCQSKDIAALTHAQLLPVQRQRFVLNNKSYESVSTLHMDDTRLRLAVKLFLLESKPELDALETADIEIWKITDESIDFSYNRVRKICFYSIHDDQIFLCHSGFAQAVSFYKIEASIDESSNGQLYAPMDGRVISVNVKAGEDVKKGQILATLDAMKIEHPITAPFDGVVQSINATSQQQVKSKQLLISIARND